jgi:hypothetical protein
LEGFFLPSFSLLERLFARKKKTATITIDPLSPTRQLPPTPSLAEPTTDPYHSLPVQEQATVIQPGSLAKLQIQEQKKMSRNPSTSYQNQRFVGRDPIRTVSSESKTIGKIGRGKEVSVYVELAHLVFEETDTGKKILRPPRVFIIISCGKGQIILNVEEAKAMGGMLSAVLPDAIYQDRMLMENKDGKDSNLKT